MKNYILLLLTSASLVSCNTPATVAVSTSSGQRLDVKTSARVGGRGAIIANMEGGTQVAIYDNNDDSFREVASVAKTGIRWGYSVAGIKSLGNTATSIVNSNNALKAAQSADALKAAQSADAVKTSAIEADAAVKSLEITTPAP